jgi:peptidoglycan/xylan/chitin deacetylase (PgdA/CDA1 family)
MNFICVHLRSSLAKSLLPFLFLSLPLSAQRTVAITIDDLPSSGRDQSLATAQHITSRLLETLTQARVPAIGFVNESKIHVPGERDPRSALLQQWIDAGLALGNHTFTHADLNAKTADWFADDTLHGEVLWRPMMQKTGNTDLWFRHPFLHTGADPAKRAAFEKFLASRGYRIAPVTMEHSDWWFADLYSRLMARQDLANADKVRAASLEYLDTMLDYHEGLTRKLFQRDIAHVFLLHANSLNALILPDILERFRRRGYRFVSLTQALRDAAYQTEDRYQGAQGPVWLHHWSLALGQPSSPAEEPDIPKWLIELDKATR